MRDPDSKVQQLLQHEDFVRGLARRLVGDPHGAEDLVQQAWLRAIQSPPREDRGLRGWVSRVVVNLARSRYRAVERRRRVELLASVPESMGCSGALDLVERRAILDRALDRISVVHRDAIRLRYYDGLAPREIARRLDVPLETVYTRLQRGLRELRGVLGPRRAIDRLTWSAILLGLRGRERGPGPRRAAPAAALAVAGALAVAVATGRGSSPAVRAIDGPPAPPAARSALVATEAARAPAPAAPPAAASVDSDAMARPAAVISARGIVLDELARPVVGASIWTSPAGAPHRAREVGFTREDGTFDANGLDPDGWIGTRMEGSRSRLYYVGDPIHAERGRLELRLPGASGRTIAGRVTDADGAPVEGADVSVPAHALPRARICRDGCLQLPFPPEPVRTDADGRFELHGLPPGTQRIRIEAEGFRPRERAIHLMESAAEPEHGRGGVDVVMERRWLAAGAAPIRGIALDEEGAPLADHVVWMCAESDLVSPHAPRELDVVQRTRTDAAGRFEFPSEDGTALRIELLSAPARAGAPRVVLATVPIPAGSDASALELRARSATLGGIRGRVIGLPGQDLSQVRITLRSAGLADALVLRPDPGSGAFECEAIPDGRVDIGVWTPGVYQPWLLAAEARGSSTDVGAIHAVPTGSIRLDLEPAPDADLSGLWVSLKYEHGGQVRISASVSIEGGEIRDGSAWFPRVPPGRHRIVLGGETLGRTAVPIEVQPGGEARATVELATGIPCRLSWVADPRGSAVIAVRRHEGDEVFRAPARPSAGGRRSVDVLLAPGRYDAELIGDGRTLETPFRVAPRDAGDGVDVLLAP